MDVLMTGSYGRCGTVIIEHLHDHEGHDWTRFNRSDRPDNHPYGGYETVVVDPPDYDALSSAMEGRDAVVHLAAYPYSDGSWDDVHDPNIADAKNMLELYFGGHGVAPDHTGPVRPDSYHGPRRPLARTPGRQHVENYEYPNGSTRFESVLSADPRETTPTLARRAPSSPVRSSATPRSTSAWSAITWRCGSAPGLRLPNRQVAPSR